MNGEERLPSRIARIGLALELADGTTVKLYTDQCGAATASIDQETEFTYNAWGPGDPLRRMVMGTQTTITLAGLNSYDLQITYPPRPELEGRQAIETAGLPILEEAPDE